MYMCIYTYVCHKVFTKPSCTYIYVYAYSYIYMCVCVSEKLQGFHGGPMSLRGTLIYTYTYIYTHT